MKNGFRVILGAIVPVMIAASMNAFAGAADAATLTPRAAERSAAAGKSMILAATQAGERLVAVGERGVVLLSDDKGLTWRQAAKVPVNAALTAVSFVDQNTGWAVGHWGAILNTVDGGETWTSQRLDTSEDRPLFSVRFTDAQHGIAVGLWSLMLRTADGGRTWDTVKLAPPPNDSRADRNLMHVFADRNAALFVVGERGTVLRSLDHGQTWTYLPSGYRGSFWSGTALADGTLLAAGLRGSLYRSGNGGESWQKVETGTQSSITSLVPLADRVLAVGLDGLMLESRDAGRSFAASQRPDRLSLTTAVGTDLSQLVLFSRAGVVPQ
ncbi:WD40/YVTN/BNR-like repeat-containing protein [Aromatoleum petrolei]|uniref:Glycosyl hydrolase n=1 Tax=Aromatoleum petrolei TaxID=76116 RepID=A0ABX1MY06_9RHOO|nr:YCF48-related protein [Aromatoleum petrolei]NMF90834.1 glycosyl hydrolase [Aromatoleum petrolei]QTQ34573.1 Ycf48/Hcf136-like protein [Aromatoleum petrolei]